ncbi:hypothetical protein DFH09DRAFT_1096049 [Mycena vulgaris]|nr:hypothetical protein DFH09DRAFT_1096049 [Mycena vulgaris]
MFSISPGLYLGTLGGGSDPRSEDEAAKILVPTDTGFNAHPQLQRHQDAITTSEPFPLASPQRGAKSFPYRRSFPRGGRGGPGRVCREQGHRRWRCRVRGRLARFAEARAVHLRMPTAQHLARTCPGYLSARDRRSARAALLILVPPPPSAQTSHARSAGLVRAQPGPACLHLVNRSANRSAGGIGTQCLPARAPRTACAALLLGLASHPRASLTASPRVLGHDVSPCALPTPPAPRSSSDLHPIRPPRSRHPPPHRREYRHSVPPRTARAALLLVPRIRAPSPMNPRKYGDSAPPRVRIAHRLYICRPASPGCARLAHRIPRVRGHDFALPAPPAPRPSYLHRGRLALALAPDRRRIVHAGAGRWLPTRLAAHELRRHAPHVCTYLYASLPQGLENSRSACPRRVRDAIEGVNVGRDHDSLARYGIKRKGRKEREGESTQDVRDAIPVQRNHPLQALELVVLQSFSRAPAHPERRGRARNGCH